MEMDLDIAIFASSDEQAEETMMNSILRRSPTKMTLAL
jgi:hypothetical protein